MKLPVREFDELTWRTSHRKSRRGCPSRACRRRRNHWHRSRRCHRTSTVLGGSIRGWWCQQEEGRGVWHGTRSVRELRCCIFQGEIGEFGDHGGVHAKVTANEGI